MTDDEIDIFLCAGLRNGTVEWPAAMPEALAQRILAFADFHGIASLLHARLAPCEGVPRLVREGLRDCAIGWAMRELGEKQALACLIPALVRRGVRPLLFKGTALAYSHYSDPALRQRADTDIFVGRVERTAAYETLTELGWSNASKMTTEVSSHQASFSFDAPGDATIHVDLHWRISNSAVLHRLFEHDDLWNRSVRLPSLHPLARGANHVDALLIACMHRLVHLRAPYYFEGSARFVPDRLIWLYDILRLTKTFTPADWAEFEQRACEKGLSDACRDGLLSAKARLGALYPETVLDARARSSSAQATATYLRASWLRREWMDFRAVEGISGKLRFLVEVIFPPAEYMRERYGGCGRRWLPWLYLRRAVGGVSKRLRGRPAETSKR